MAPRFTFTHPAPSSSHTISNATSIPSDTRPIELTNQGSTLRERCNWNMHVRVDAKKHILRGAIAVQSPLPPLPAPQPITIKLPPLKPSTSALKVTEAPSVGRITRSQTRALARTAAVSRLGSEMDIDKTDNATEGATARAVPLARSGSHPRISIQTNQRRTRPETAAQRSRRMLRRGSTLRMSVDFNMNDGSSMNVSMSMLVDPTTSTQPYPNSSNTTSDPSTAPYDPTLSQRAQLGQEASQQDIMVAIEQVKKAEAKGQALRKTFSTSFPCLNTNTQASFSMVTDERTPATEKRAYDAESDACVELDLGTLDSDGSGFTEWLMPVQGAEPGRVPKRAREGDETPNPAPVKVGRSQKVGSITGAKVVVSARPIKRLRTKKGLHHDSEPAHTVVHFPPAAQPSPLPTNVPFESEVKTEPNTPGPLTTPPHDPTACRRYQAIFDSMDLLPANDGASVGIIPAELENSFQLTQFMRYLSTRFTHIVRLVERDEAAEELHMRIVHDSHPFGTTADGVTLSGPTTNSRSVGAPRLDLLISEERRRDDDSSSSAPPKFGLTQRQIFAARDFMTLALPCDIRPESPIAFEEGDMKYHQHRGLPIGYLAKQGYHSVSLIPGPSIAPLIHAEAWADSDPPHVLIIGAPHLAQELVGLVACFGAYVADCAIDEVLGGMLRTAQDMGGKERWEDAVLGLHGNFRAVSRLHRVANEPSGPPPTYQKM